MSAEASAARAAERGRWSQFALLGADVMVDTAGRPWLLEFNHNPALPQLDLTGVISSASRAVSKARGEEEAAGAGGGGGAAADADACASHTDDAAAGGDRVGGPFARHIAAMIGAAIPLVLSAEGTEQRRLTEAAVEAGGLAGRGSGSSGRWNRVHGPPE